MRYEAIQRPSLNADNIYPKIWASGALMAPAEIQRQLTLFRNRFGPDVLRKVDGEALLQVMHGRQNAESKSLMYWLEFKNDDVFAGRRFGSIGEVRFISAPE